MHAKRPLVSPGPLLHISNRDQWRKYQLFQKYIGTMRCMRLLCTIVGHREYSPEVLEFQPWLDPDFSQHGQEDFREPNCLRCGEPTQVHSEAA